MSVLIKGMDMPENCMHCSLSSMTSSNEVLQCRALNFKKMLREDVTKCRYEHCPLVEVKTPHGRLIDNDELERSAPDEFGIIEWSAPTIIEAEE